MFDMITNNKRIRDIFDSHFLADLFTPNGHFGLNLDIKEYDMNYEFIIEIPGIKKEDIFIQMERDIITISIDKMEYYDEEFINYIRNEREFGSMTRSFKIPDVDAKDITAKYEDGLLKIHLPKSETSSDTIKSIMID